MAASCVASQPLMCPQRPSSHAVSKGDLAPPLLCAGAHRTLIALANQRFAVLTLRHGVQRSTYTAKAASSDDELCLGIEYRPPAAAATPDGSRLVLRAADRLP